MRGPFDDTLLDGGAGDVIDTVGGPLGVLTATVFLLAASVVLGALIVGAEALLGAVLGPWLPSWLAMPLLVASVGVVIVGGFLGALRFMTWRRRSW